MVWETLAGRPIVIYLIDARALCGCLRWTDWEGSEHRGPERLVEDAVFLSRWLHQGEARLCVLVVTHTDEDCRRRLAAIEGGSMSDAVYKGHIIRQITPLRLKLGGEDRVRVVIGSLADRASTEAVVAAVVGHIERWDSGRTARQITEESNS
jgi:hypothetical protein